MQIPTVMQLALAGLLASSAAAFQAPQGPTAVACRVAGALAVLAAPVVAVPVADVADSIVARDEAEVEGGDKKKPPKKGGKKKHHHKGKKPHKPKGPKGGKGKPEAEADTEADTEADA
ncbi:hypothetical protein MCOR25_001437 [Pyricularia grisea]|uniref:Uncharacterized protein n=1 Tax=Pyricularia grisea TaxID=148305 RepID=A0A6P8AVV3_PYRGI|nr:uncharacterized protein PgNI_08703 [Pyricularia grisea]KAI6380911.1 hypothetical protein MCOR25_001437 [Pyricularia grisea]TLD06322.1 hypothetical protein PgNI_08703 [Pyricularia grisea]